MTPKEKAIELIDKFNNHTVKELFYLKNGKVIEGKTDAKQCALIAVDEILNTIVHKDQDERLAYELLGNKFYWEDVKQEIENL